MSAVHTVIGGHSKHIVIVGCDQNYGALNYILDGKVDSIIAENTYAMGYRAAQLLLAVKAGKAAPHLVKIKPILVTRENMNSPELLNVLTHDARVQR